MKLRPWYLAFACLVLGILLTDLCLSWFALGDGEFMGRPVPPYADVREERWQAWATRRREAAKRPGAPAQVLVHDGLLGWTNARDYRSTDGSQRTNSKGLRATREFDSFPAPGTLRVALFGESFIYGEEVPDGDEFAAQLAALDPGLEPLNFGVSGFGTDQALMRLRSEGLDCHAQVYCIGVMLENIVRNVSRLTRLRNPYVKALGVKPRFRLEQGALTLVPSPFPAEQDVFDAVEAHTLPDLVRQYDAFAEAPYDQWIWKSSLARLWMGWRGSVARDYRLAWADEECEAFRVTLAILEAFDREARAAGAQRVLVLIFPPKEDLALELAGDRRFGSVSRALAQRGIEALDLTEPLAVRARELAGAQTDPTAISNQVFLRAHLNRIGNEVVARAVRDRLGP